MNLSQLVKDFNQRYQNTWIRLIVKGRSRPTPFLVKKAFIDSGQIFIELYNNADKYVIINYATSQKLLFDLPKFGWVLSNHGHHIFLTKSHKRQWKRGLYAHSYVIVDPFAGFKSFATKKLLTLNEHNVEQLFYPQYVPLNEALDMINNKEILSIALNNRAALIKVCDKVKFYLNVCPIGEFNGNSLTFFHESFQTHYENWKEKADEALY